MKYMGSKQKFAKEIYKVICEKTPRSNRAWVEPFAGRLARIQPPPTHILEFERS